MALVKGQEHDGIKILATARVIEAAGSACDQVQRASAASKIAAAGGKTVVVAYRPHAVSGRPQSAAPATA